MNQAEISGKEPSPWVVLLLGIVAFTGLIGLGTWQVQRLAWKQALVETIVTRSTSEPKPLADVERVFADTGDVDYLPTELSGRFDHAHESHFLATWKGKSGFFIYTPLVLDGGRTAFVNRGFVPYAKKDAASRGEGQIEGVISIRGLARNPLAQRPSSITPDNDPAKNVFYWKELPIMAAKAGVTDASKLVSFFVDADAAPNPGGLPIGGVTLIDMPNRHLEYAVTWFGLAAALAGVFGAWFWRRRGAA